MLILESLLRDSKRKKENEMILKDWCHLRGAHEQDPEIVHQVITKDPYAIMFVRNQTEELCFLAVTRDVNTYGFIKANWKSVDGFVRNELGLLPSKIITPYN